MKGKADLPDPDRPLTLGKPFLDEILTLLGPLMKNENERRALLSLALGLDHPLLHRVELAGPSDTVLLNLVRDLADFGELESGRPALRVLLETARERVGPDRQHRFDRLLARYDEPSANGPPPWWHRRAAILVALLVVVVAAVATSVALYPLYQQTQQQRRQVQSLVRQAEDLLNVGQRNAARGLYRQALKLDPENPAANWGLRKSAAYDQEPDAEFDSEVIRTRLRSLLAEHPADPHLHALLADQHAIAAEYEQAERAYRTPLTHRPDLATAHFGLGNLFLKQDQDLQALKHLRRAVELSPSNREYLTNLAYAHTRQGDYRGAVQHYDKALRVDADFLLPYYEIATAYRMLGELDQALAQQRHLATLLDDPRIVGLAKNQDVWYFPTGAKAGPVYLDTWQHKRCYARLSLAATRHLLGRDPRGASDAGEDCALDELEENEIRWLAALDLQRLAERQPEFAARAEAYAQALLTRPSPTGQDGAASGAARSR